MSSVPTSAITPAMIGRALSRHVAFSIIPSRRFGGFYSGQ